jgi:hypothetical protein
MRPKGRDGGKDGGKDGGVMDVTTPLVMWETGG